MVRRPAYDRNALEPGVVHIGLGAFHRAHQAPVFQALAEAGDLRWGVIGASLRSPAVRNALAPQDYLYTLAVDHCDRRDVSVVNVIRDVIVAPEQPKRLVEAIAAPDTRIVTVTVTEKGYQDVADDIADQKAPRTMPGYLAAGLRARREAGRPPITIMSCDNIVGNSSQIRTSVAKIARSHDPSLADWIERECAFPGTMVDRIVPVTRDGDVEDMAAQLGVVDCATVRTEAFWQWVIEDSFAGERTDFEAAGVRISKDIVSWEQAKLRLLNGAHSAIAYLGLLSGIQTVDRFVAEGWGGEFVQRLWDEMQQTLGSSPELDVESYRERLLERFRNPALGHRLQQIAMDGSQKLPQRLIGPALELIQAGRPPSAIALAIAAWMRFQSGRSDAGERLENDDPLAPKTAQLTASAVGPEDQMAALLGVESIFPKRLALDPRFRTLVAGHLDDLHRLGARATVERFMEPGI